MVMPYFEEQNVKLFHGDCIDTLNSLPENSVDMIFADPPYFLSNGGISCKSGKMVSVNKAEWDKSNGLDKDFEFTYNWINSCRRVLKNQRNPLVFFMRY
jgi:site-specific DNA-methyltransferase (adenine-specific)